MHNAYLSLGSNIGNREDNINKAISILSNNIAIEIKEVSSFYETEPVGYIQQDLFVNIAIHIATSLEPYELLRQCQDIEEKLKRKRIIHWGPRSIDVDILLYDELENADEELIIPHPRMTERAFVMIPLCEIAPTLIIQGRNIKDIIIGIEGQGINKLEKE